MNFSDALNLLNQGYEIRLPNWPKDSWLYKKDGVIYHRFFKISRKVKMYIRIDDILRSDWIASKGLFKE